MAQPMVTRTQRRTEKKQAWSIVALVVVVAAVSFACGVVVGQQGFFTGLGEGPVREVRLPMATQIPAPQPPPEEETPKLTFYDNLPQGSQAPLGSGINLPPQGDEPGEAKPQSAGRKPEVKAPVRSASPETAAKPVAKPAPVAQQATSSDGAFVVQIASFRTAEDAEKLSGRLKVRRIPAFVERADLGDKGVWHRVLAGPYAQRNVADQVVGRLKQEERLSALVRRR